MVIEKQRRRAILVLPVRTVLNLLIDSRPDKDTVFVSRLGGVPDGAEIISVHQDVATNSLLITLEHESFDVISEGVIPKRIEATVYRSLCKIAERGPMEQYLDSLTLLGVDLSEPFKKGTDA